MKRVVYFIMKRVTRISVGAFFSRIEIVGTENIPRDRAIIFAPNHQNAFLDAFMVGCISPVGIHYLTRADVFNNPFRWFMDALQMMPIYRIRDGFGQLSQNAGVFEACRKLFSQRKSVLIFPEGNHGENYYLRPLTKGISRLACESQEAMENDELWIQPVGLNYFDLRKPRRKAMVVFGKPLRVKDYMDEYNHQKAKALKDLRDQVSAEMLKVMIIPENDENYAFKVSALTKKNESLRFDELRELLATVNSAESQRRPIRFFTAIAKFLGIANLPPLLVISHVLKTKIKDVVFTSSIKWAIGLFLFPIWWLLLFLVSLFLFGAKMAWIVLGVAIVLLFLRQEFMKLAN